MADITVTAAKVALVFPEQSEVYNVKLAEAVTKGQALYQTTSGTYGLADANAAGKQQFRGIALEAAYKKNRKFLEKGFIPETNNTMEQLFSFIDDFIYQAKSFKIVSGLKNWAANMFSVWNHRKFNTGYHRGETPLEIARTIDPG